MRDRKIVETQNGRSRTSSDWSLVQVDVLIGADNYYSFVTGVCKRGSSSESLVAVESCLGWIVTGQVNFIHANSCRKQWSQ